MRTSNYAHSLSSSAILPIDFTPTDNSIIIGRGRQVKNHVANKKFDKMVAVIATEYQGATCKAEKGNILSKLITQVNNLGADAGFVKKDPVTGRWLQVEESLARTTAAQAIRNYLHSHYRSSKQFKQKRRLQQIRDGIIPTSGTSSSLRRAAKEAQRAAQAQTQVQGRCVSPSSSSSASLSDGEDMEQDYHRRSSYAGSVSSTTRSSMISTMQQADTFSILFNAFGKVTACPTEDPFAPTPMKECCKSSAAPSNSMNLTTLMTNKMMRGQRKQGQETVGSALAGMLTFKQTCSGALEQLNDVTSDTFPVEDAFDARFESLLSQIQPSSKTTTTAAV